MNSTNQTPESKTPRTDAAEFEVEEYLGDGRCRTRVVVLSKDARQLETELGRWTESWAKDTSSLRQQLTAAQAEIAELRKLITDALREHSLSFQEAREIGYSDGPYLSNSIYLAMQSAIAKGKE